MWPYYNETTYYEGPTQGVPSGVKIGYIQYTYLHNEMHCNQQITSFF